MASGAMEEIPPHPYLNEPILYVSNLPGHISDETIARTLEFCVPFRPRLARDPTTGNATGSIEFRTIERAEKALATLDARPMTHAFPQVILHLYPSPPLSSPAPSWPPPSAAPRAVSNLPPGFSDSKLFDTFRGFGAIASCRMHPEMGNDIGLVTFWREEDATRAEEVMHMSEVDDYNISVKVYHPREYSGGIGSGRRKAQEFNPQAPSFVPSGLSRSTLPGGITQQQIGYQAATMMRHPGSPPLQPFSLSPMPSPHLSLANHSPMMMPGAQLPVMYSPPRIPMPFPRSPSMSPFVHGPGQQVQYAPQTGPGSTSASGLIDPCNLFCKNLDPEMDSKTLHAHFRQFGHIVSARIMRNEHGQSRGFGFVSYQTPDQANRALSAMNGATLGTKQIVVRLHEPKQLRKEKLAQRFAQGGIGGNGHPRSGSGATSPTLSEGGDSVAGWGGSAFGRPRRGSGSYYQAALTGTLHMPLSFDELAGLSPVVRHEVLTGELMRRLRSFPEVKEEDIEGVVNQLLAQSLDTVCTGLDNSTILLEQVRTAKEVLGLATPPTESLQNDSFGGQGAIPSSSTLLDPSTLAATASAPEHPSTPVSFTPSMNTPPRTASPTGSIAPGTEKERLLAAVAASDPRYRSEGGATKAAEVTDMLLSLSKKERAMCLFSTEYLRTKIDSARSILDALAEEDEAPSGVSSAAVTAAMSNLSVNAVTPTTPQPQHRPPATGGTPQTPDLSHGSSMAASPGVLNTPSILAISPAITTSTPAGPAQSAVSVHTLATLAKLPAIEIIRLTSGSAGVTGLPVPKADPAVVKSTDEFVDNLVDRPMAVQKQHLGEKLFKTIKGFGIKGAPKVTISLLDNEDLRSLAHLMNSYPSVLKEKVLQQTAPTK